MNAWGMLVLWAALQVTVFCTLAALLYLLARRHSPAAGAWAAGAALLVVPLITALAVLPWTPWGWAETSAPAQVVRNAIPQAVAKPPVQPADHEQVPTPQDEPTSPQANSRWAELLAQLQIENAVDEGSDGTVGWRWPAWLLAAALALAAVAVLHFLAAMISVARFRRRTRHVCDGPINQLLIEVCQQLKCRATIELRETEEFCSPSTSGWLSPLIVLPRSWRTWSEAEQRSVLAHEVAHVVRGDFALWTATQVASLAHIYNPAVRWLLARLQLEQELAADALAASAAGGAKAYLTVLARMALERDRVSFASASQPFLPRPRTLMRRVEMLNQEIPRLRLQLPLLRRGLLFGALLLGGLVVAGVRGPLVHPLAQAADPAAGKPDVAKAAETPPADVPQTGPAFNLDYIPDDPQFVMACRPDALIKMQPLAGALAMFEGLGLFESLTLPLAEIEEMKFSLVDPQLAGPGGNTNYSVLMLRSRKPHDWSKYGAYFAGKTEQAVIDGQQYFRATEPAPQGRYSYWLPDDRTIVIVPTGSIAKTFSLRGNEGGPAWKSRWEKVARAPAVMMVQRPLFEMYLDVTINPPTVQPKLVKGEEDGVLLMAANETKSGLQVTGSLPCSSPESAQKQLVRVQTALQLTVERTRDMSASAAQSPQGIFLRVAAQLADATKLQVAGDTIQSTTAVKLEVPGGIAGAVGNARAAAQRARSTNNMKIISIALLNYHDMKKRFPAPIIMGPDGVTPHSWRLEILPLLGSPEAKAIYDEYKQDEPWDSEHNKPLIARGAKFFSHPSDTEQKSCAYLAITGPGTIFDETAQPMSIRKITDGTSRTIWFVENKSDVPWSKPEDLKIEADKPLPKIGGFNPDSFTAAYADGSVQKVPGSVNEKTLRALFSRNGREVVNSGPDGPENLPE